MNIHEIAKICGERRFRRASAPHVHWNFSAGEILHTVVGPVGITGMASRDGFLAEDWEFLPPPKMRFQEAIEKLSELGAHGRMYRWGDGPALYRVLDYRVGGEFLVWEKNQTVVIPTLDSLLANNWVVEEKSGKCEEILDKPPGL